MIQMTEEIEKKTMTFAPLIKLSNLSPTILNLKKNIKGRKIYELLEKIIDL